MSDCEESCFCYVDALSPNSGPGQKDVVKYGVRRALMERLVNVECWHTAIGQFWGIVHPGLIVARHCFKGLERGHHFRGNMEADKDVYIYTWTPRWDYVWQGGGAVGRIERMQPHPNRVFGVLVCVVNEEPDLQGALGYIERWNWINREDPLLAGAPIEHGERYQRNMWSRQS